MKSKNIKPYLLQNGILLPNGQIELTQPLKAFKKVTILNKKGYPVEAIANLVIPRGSIINVPDNGDNKLRASEAICWSIVSSKEYRDYKTARGIYKSYFKYFSAKSLGANPKHVFTATAKTIHLFPEAVRRAFCKPHTFDFSKDQCGGGIHFFADVESAKRYSLL